VLREDALDVIELMSRSVDEIHTDEFGTIDRSRGGAGGVSNRKVKKAFVNELYRLIGAGADCTDGRPTEKLQESSTVRFTILQP
jgi:hypothetical protein